MIFDDMKQSTERMLAQIINHAFIRELAAGTLPLPIFQFYLLQDSYYLHEFSKALSLIAARLPLKKHVQQYMQFAHEALQAEMMMHQSFIANVAPTDLTPACFMYTNYLLRVSSQSPVEIALAAVLPCFWIYEQVGQIILKTYHLKDNPYQNWISLYASPEFSNSVRIAIEVTNESAIGKDLNLHQNMLQAFTRSTQLEWLFWDDAYYQRNWPF